MGKGDRRTKRGKIWRGTYGKCRPKPKKLRRLKKLKALAEKQQKEEQGES